MSDNERFKYDARTWAVKDVVLSPEMLARCEEEATREAVQAALKRIRKVEKGG